MKPFALLFIALFGCQLLMAQEEGTPAKINWMSLEEAQKLNEKEPRKIMIDLYTSWCGWCKRMDATTFSHPQVVEYVNKKYYAVKLDAETRDTIHFREQEFVNPNPPSTRRATHQIAAIGAQENGRLGFPTIVYLDEELNRLSVVPGYQTAEGIEPIITYFGDDHYKSIPWNDYQTQFKGTITATE